MLSGEIALKNNNYYYYYFFYKSISTTFVITSKSFQRLDIDLLLKHTKRGFIMKIYGNKYKYHTC